MGFEYSSVVLILKSEYLSTTIEYFPSNNKLFNVYSYIIFVYFTGFCKILTGLYSMQYACTTYILYLNIKLITKNTLIHCETEKRN